VCELHRFKKHKTEMLYYCAKFTIEDLPQFIIQVLYLLKTSCGTSNHQQRQHTNLHLSAHHNASYCGVHFRLTIYLYHRKRLHNYKKCVELKLGNHEIEIYGFKQIKRMIPFINDVQAITPHDDGHQQRVFLCQ